MESFRELYERHYADVYRFALFLTSDPTRAEDLAADTFARAWTSRERIRQATVKAYLLTITRNLYRDGLRRQRPVTELDDRLEDPSPSAEQRAADASALGLVKQRLLRAAEGDRRAFVLHTFEGLSYAQVARALGITTGAVKSRIFRVREALAGIRSMRPKGDPR
ncbi:MAG: RNA polymerase sigma factor [Vicinamibacterales bacterium]